jgi:hypothetical protein
MSGSNSSRNHEMPVALVPPAPAVPVDVPPPLLPVGVVVGGTVVSPRRGNYFVRGVLYYDKDYTELNDGLDKPRFGLAVRNEEHTFDFDDEGYLGFSVFIPETWEDETGSTGIPGGLQVLTVGVNTGSTLLGIVIYVPNGETKSRWYARLFNDDRSTEGTNETKTMVDLGPVSPDKGKWTDFVIRYRSNPFKTRTNPASLGIPNAFNRTYEGNRGIMQIWKSEGRVDGNGNREMIRKYSVINAPVGLVPGADDGRSKIGFGVRGYKYGWQREQTTVTGPIWIGLDEVRQGQVARNGTTYADVHPAGLACTDRCPGASGDSSPASVAPPKAPTNVTISGMQ